MSNLQSFKQELEKIIDVQDKLTSHGVAVKRAKDNAKLVILYDVQLKPGQVPALSEDVLQSANHLQIILSYFPKQGETWTHPYTLKKLRCAINVYAPENIEAEQFTGQIAATHTPDDRYTFLRMNEQAGQDKSYEAGSKARSMVAQMFEGAPEVTSLEATCDLEKLKEDYCISINEPNNTLKKCHPIGDQWEYITAVLKQHFTSNGIETSEVDISEQARVDLQKKNEIVKRAEEAQSKTLDEYKAINPRGMEEEEAQFLNQYTGELIKIEELVSEYTKDSSFPLPNTVVQGQLRKDAISFKRLKHPDTPELQLLHKLSSQFNPDMGTEDLYNLTGRMYEQLERMWTTESPIGKFFESRKEHYLSLLQSPQPTLDNPNQ